jgi:hypothetical protein
MSAVTSAGMSDLKEGQKVAFEVERDERTDVDRPLPAGTYRVVVDEEDISSLSLLAFRRIATMLHVPAISTPGGSVEMFLVNPDELAAALASDLVAAQRA